MVSDPSYFLSNPARILAYFPAKSQYKSILSAIYLYISLSNLGNRKRMNSLTKQIIVGNLTQIPVFWLVCYLLPIWFTWTLIVITIVGFWASVSYPGANEIWTNSNNFQQKLTVFFFAVYLSGLNYIVFLKLGA